MSNSVWSSMTKRDIDQATEEFVKLANKGLLTYDCYDGNGEREKNKRFLKDYIVPWIGVILSLSHYNLRNVEMFRWIRDWRTIVTEISCMCTSTMPN